MCEAKGVTPVLRAIRQPSTLLNSSFRTLLRERPLALNCGIAQSPTYSTASFQTADFLYG